MQIQQITDKYIPHDLLVNFNTIHLPRERGEVLYEPFDMEHKYFPLCNQCHQVFNNHLFHTTLNAMNLGYQEKGESSDIWSL